MTQWSGPLERLAAALGAEERSDTVLDLLLHIGTLFDVTEHGPSVRYAFHESGVELTFDAGVLARVAVHTTPHLADDPDETFAPVERAPIAGLPLRASAEDVVGMFGNPHEEGQDDGAPWVRYCAGNRFLTFSFDGEDRVAIVTVTPREVPAEEAEQPAPESASASAPSPAMPDMRVVADGGPTADFAMQFPEGEFPVPTSELPTSAGLDPTVVSEEHVPSPDLHDDGGDSTLPVEQASGMDPSVVSEEPVASDDGDGAPPFPGTVPAAADAAPGEGEQAPQAAPAVTPAAAQANPPTMMLPESAGRDPVAAPEASANTPPPLIPPGGPAPGQARARPKLSGAIAYFRGAMGADETGPQIAAIIRAAPCRPEFNVSGSTAEYRFRDAGFTLYFTNRVLETVYLFTQHFQDPSSGVGYRPFAAPPIDGLHPNATLDDVVRRFGPPDKYPQGPSISWVLYEFGSDSLLFSFDPSGRTVMVGLRTKRPAKPTA